MHCTSIYLQPIGATLLVTTPVPIVETFFSVDPIRLMAAGLNMSLNEYKPMMNIPMIIREPRNFIDNVDFCLIFLEDILFMLLIYRNPVNG